MSHEKPYARFTTDDLILRDVLAVDRTIIANERTLLGYARTTLALMAAGGSLLHFFTATWATAAGLVLIGAGLPLWIVGVVHYLRRRAALVPLMTQRPASPRPAPLPEPESELEPSYASPTP